MSEELKPCPFCGSTDIDIVRCDDGCCGALIRWFECCSCGCEKPPDKSHPTDNEAIESWNRRSIQSTERPEHGAD